MVISPNVLKTIKDPENDIRCVSHGRHKATKGWIGAVDFYDGGSSVLISSLSTTFTTAKLAIKHMRSLVRRIREDGRK